MQEAWEGFKEGIWTGEVDVRDFIQKNYTPYEGDESFLVGPTERTKELWGEVLDLLLKEREQGGVLDMDTKTVTGIVTGLTMGTTVLIGQRIGQGKPEKAARAVGTSVLLFVALAAVLTVLMLLLARPFAHLMNAPEEAFSSTVRYVAVCSAGIVFIVAYNVISGILRGLGDSKMPLVFVAIACVVNIVGDLVLVGP